MQTPPCSQRLFQEVLWVEVSLRLSQLACWETISLLAMLSLAEARKALSPQRLLALMACFQVVKLGMTALVANLEVLALVVQVTAHPRTRLLALYLRMMQEVPMPPLPHLVLRIQ